VTKQTTPPQTLRTASVDWPARFRAAAQGADRKGAYGTADHLRRVADDLTHRHAYSPAVVEAIGRGLLGETGKDH
jgi:hypothetical protein